MKIFKISSLNLISLGFWILPDGKVVNLGGCSHSAYVSKHYNDFEISEEEIYKCEDVYKLAFDKGAVRISILKAFNTHNFFAIQGSQDAIYNLFDVIQKIYHESAPKGASIVVEDALSKKFERFNKIDEIFEFASNKNIIRVANNYINGWLMPDGRVELLGLTLHPEYVLKNIEQFGVSTEFKNNIRERDLYDSDLYRIAFKFGAIRFSVNRNIFSIQCTKEALSKYIERVHRLYKSYIHGSGEIYLDLVSLDSEKISPKWGKKITLEDLFEYASSNSWYKTAAKKGISRAEKQNIEAFVEKIKKGYHNWSPEDIQLYQNNAQIIEKLLRNEKVNWVLIDELDEELESLKNILRL